MKESWPRARRSPQNRKLERWNQTTVRQCPLRKTTNNHPQRPPAPNADRPHKTQSLNASRTPRHRQLPLDEPTFLWYCSSWVQLRLIPVLACAHLPPQQSAQFWCNISPLDATLPSLLVCVANKGLAQYLSPLDATLTKNIGVGGALLCRPRPQVPPLLRRNPGPLESTSYELQIL